MVRWAMSNWKTVRKNRKGKYLCAVGTPTCHMSQPPPLFALSVFSPSVFFSAVYLCVSSRMCLSSIFVSGRREGQLVFGGRAVSHWVRWLRLRWEEEESKRGGEPRETELLLSPPLSPALWKYVSKYKDTYVSIYESTDKELDWHPVDFHLLQSQLSSSLHLKGWQQQSYHDQWKSWQILYNFVILIGIEK